MTIIHNTKKGALFGLDARITMLILAIMGLIVFPIMNGVISKSKAEAILTVTKTVNLAIESYIADTGSTPIDIDRLYDTLPDDSDQAAKWNGPYLKGYKTDKFVPEITWTTLDDDCTNPLKSSGYCTLQVNYNFCEFRQAVYEKLKNYYSADQVITYTSGTKCIAISYGNAKTGIDETSIGFKVKELP